MTEPIPVRYARLTPREIADQLEMIADALTIPDNPNAPRLREIQADLERVQRVRGAVAPTPAEPVTVEDRAGRQRVAGGGAGHAYPASEKQVAYLKRLVAERDLSGAGSKLGPIDVPANLDGIGKKHASALIDRLLGAPYKTAAPTPANAPSEKQVGLVTKLLGEKDLMASVFNPVPGVELHTLEDWQAYLPRFTRQTVSKAIDALFTYPRKPEPAKVEIAAGAYRVDGRIIRVYLGQQSGRMLAAELVDPHGRTRDDAWQYLGAAGRFVPADAHRLTVEECEALAAGDADHGWCCVCGRELDDPNSVRRGIGPVCRAKQGAF